MSEIVEAVCLQQLDIVVDEAEELEALTTGEAGRGQFRDVVVRQVWKFHYKLPLSQT